MARRRRGRRGGRRGFKIPVLTLAILGGQAMLANGQGGDWAGKLNAFQKFYTGFDVGSGSFEPASLVVGYGPWVAKGLAMKIARPMGAAPRIPFGLPFSFS